MQNDFQSLFKNLNPQKENESNEENWQKKMKIYFSSGFLEDKEELSAMKKDDGGNSSSVKIEKSLFIPQDLSQCEPNFNHLRLCIYILRFSAPRITQGGPFYTNSNEKFKRLIEQSSPHIIYTLIRMRMFFVDGIETDYKLHSKSLPVNFVAEEEEALKNIVKEFKKFVREGLTQYYQKLSDFSTVNRKQLVAVNLWKNEYNTLFDGYVKIFPSLSNEIKSF